MTKRPFAISLTAAIAVLLLGGCTAGPTAGGDLSVAPTSSPSEAIELPSGVQGAVNFDEGYVQLGAGEKVVDLFIDPLCPYCKLFETASGPLLFDEVDSGRATLRVYPLAVLNRLSLGTKYSTRAAATFVAVAAGSPDQARDFLVALYEHQPAENTAGLTAEQLQELASSMGATVPADTLAQYEAWVDAETLDALNGPLPATRETTAITQVPTVIVNGSVFHGDSNETAEFTAFYNRS